MTPREAAEIADEQIAWWQRQGLTAGEAWRALTGWPVFLADGADVRGYMIRWLLSEERRAA